MVRQTVLPVKLEMGEEKVTARSGLILLYEHMISLGAIEDVRGSFPFPGSGRGYDAERYVVSLVLMLHGGGRSLEDLREIETDVVLREMVGLKEMPRPCTVGDWLRRMGEAGERALGVVNRGVMRKVLKADKRKEYTLDVDATVIEAEKEEAEWSYKKVKGYQPLMGYLAEVPVCLRGEFRAGNVPAGSRMVEFLKSCLKELPVGKRIGCLRSDSAGYQAEVINWCVNEGIRYTITADKIIILTVTCQNIISITTGNIFHLTVMLACESTSSLSYTDGILQFSSQSQNRWKLIFQENRNRHITP